MATVFIKTDTLKLYTHSSKWSIQESDNIWWWSNSLGESGSGVGGFTQFWKKKMWSGLKHLTSRLKFKGVEVMNPRTSKWTSKTTKPNGEAFAS